MGAFTCRKCGSDEIIIRQVGEKRGVYCKDCMAWIAWVDTADIRKLRSKTERAEDEAARVFKKFENGIKMSCGNCKTLLYNSAKKRPEGQFDLLEAKYCPYCGKRLV